MEVKVNGARILFEFFGIKITETQVNSWIVMLFVFFLCLWLTHDLKVRPTGKKQVIAEYLVVSVKKLVTENMGKKLEFFTPFIASIMSLSALSSLSALLTWKPPTSDLNTTLGWALTVFFMIIFYKIKTLGFTGYLKSYTQPIAVLTPFNLISDIATPISMAFRHFGNIVSGVVISSLVYGALSSLSSLILGSLPGVLGRIPIFELGIPAILSIYFDLFGSLLQAFIFAMLTMVYVKMAANTED